MKDFFTSEAAKSYDEKNKQLAPIADNMHFLIRLILKDLPKDSRILCVGVGTGAEILSLAKEYPGWSFVGVDPSSSMLEVCRKRMEDAGIADRCTFIHGYAQDVPVGEKFDAALSILVGHFIKKEERVNFYEKIHELLSKGGYFVNTEISFDLDSKNFPSMLKNWERVQTLMGATPDSLKALPNLLRDPLTVLPPSEVENLFNAGGFMDPVRFFQAFMIIGWYARCE